MASSPLPPHCASSDAPIEDWYQQLVAQERMRHFWTLRRDPTESVEMFVARFVGRWKEVSALGITDYEAGQQLVRLLPDEWKVWADRQLEETSYPHPCTGRPVGIFPSFVSRVFFRCADPTTAIPLPIVPAPIASSLGMFAAPDAIVTQLDSVPIPPPFTLPIRKRGFEYEAGPSGVPQNDQQRLQTLLQTLPAVEEQVGETPDRRSRSRARTIPADPVIPREFRIRLEEYGQPFALPPEDPARLEAHFGSVPPDAPTVPAASAALVPVIDVDDEEDPEEGSSVGSVRGP